MTTLSAAEIGAMARKAKIKAGTQVVPSADGQSGAKWLTPDTEPIQIDLPDRLP
jgi:hypothetical protein